MIGSRSIRAELDALRAEVDALRAVKSSPPPRPDADAASAAPGLDQPLRQLIAQAEELLGEAEDTVAAHPVASAAAALALGIVIGRLMAR